MSRINLIYKISRNNICIETKVNNYEKQVSGERRTGSKDKHIYDKRAV